MKIQIRAGSHVDYVSLEDLFDELDQHVDAVHPSRERKYQPNEQRRRDLQRQQERSFKRSSVA